MVFLFLRHAEIKTPVLNLSKKSFAAIQSQQNIRIFRIARNPRRRMPTATGFITSILWYTVPGTEIYRWKAQPLTAVVFRSLPSGSSLNPDLYNKYE